MNMELPMQWESLFTRVTRNMWVELPESTRQEMMAGYLANRTAVNITRDGETWLLNNAVGEEHTARCKVVGRHTVVEIWKIGKLRGGNNTSSWRDIDTFVARLEEPTVEFVSPTMFTKIKLVCG